MVLSEVLTVQQVRIQSAFISLWLSNGALGTITLVTSSANTEREGCAALLAEERRTGSVPVRTFCHFPFPMAMECPV